MDAQSTLVLTISGRPASGNYDSVHLVNGGSATLAGALDIQFNGGFKPVDFDQYTVLATTGAVHGQFRTLTSNLPSTFFIQKVSAGTGDSIEIINQTLFSPYAGSANGLAVANYIDHFATPFGKVPQELQIALAELSLLPPGQISATLERLTPQAPAEVTSGIAVQNGIFESQQVFEQIREQFNGITAFNIARFSVLNDPDADPFTADLDSIMHSNAQAAQAAANLDVTPADAGANGPVPAAPTPYPIALTPPNSLSGFLTGQVIFAKLPGVNNQNPSFTTGNAIAGINYDIASRLALGTFFQYGYTGAKLDDAGGTLTDHSYSPGVYAGLRKRDVHLDALASYTYNDYTQHRDILNTTASSRPAGNQLDLSAMAGYDFGPPSYAFGSAGQGLKWGPAVGLGYTYLNISGYSETGGAINLNVSSQTVNSLRSLLGGQVSDTWHGTSSPLPWSWNLSAFWQHEYLDDSQSITASITGLGGSFAVNTARPQRDSALLGAGLNGYLSKNISVFLDYQTQIGENNLLVQSVMAGVAVALK